VPVIRSFADDTESVWKRLAARRWSVDVQRSAYRKLLIIDAAEAVADLNVPPGNRLEKLAGDRAGQYSIRINKQWKVCFKWRDGNGDEVEITDYH
jgi:proteic killer suppression protein